MRQRNNNSNKISLKETIIWISVNAVLLIPVFFIIGTIIGNTDNTQIGDSNIYFQTQMYLISLVMLIVGIGNIGVYKFLKIKELK